MHRPVVPFVIVPQKVQKSVGHQERHFRAEGPAGEAGLAAGPRERNGDLAQVRLAGLQIAGGRKGEDVGHAIHPAMATVEGADCLVGSEKEIHAGPGHVGRLEQPLQDAAAVSADGAAARIPDDDLYFPHRRVGAG